MSQNDSYSNDMSHSSRPFNNNNNNSMRSMDKRYSMVNSNVSSPNSMRPMDNMQNPPPMSQSYMPPKSKYNIILIIYMYIFFIYFRN